jgi:hypothetical protein
MNAYTRTHMCFYVYVGIILGRTQKWWNRRGQEPSAIQLVEVAALRPVYMCVCVRGYACVYIHASEVKYM